MKDMYRKIKVQRKNRQKKSGIKCATQEEEDGGWKNLWGI